MGDPAPLPPLAAEANPVVRLVVVVASCAAAVIAADVRVAYARRRTAYSALFDGPPLLFARRF